FKPAVQDRSSGAGEDFDRFPQPRPELAHGTPEAEELPEVAETRLQQIGRRHRQRRLDDIGYPFQHRLVLRICFGVARAEFRNLALVEPGIGPKEEMPAVWKRGERGWISLEDLQAVFLQ